MKLTKTIIENAQLPRSGQKFLWDDEVRGFAIRLTPTSRSYIIQARVNGRSRRVSLGRCEILTLQQARKRARAELATMLEGKDPSVEKRRAEAYSLTLRQIVEQYLRDRADLKPRSQADIRRHLDTSFHAWADRPATEISRDMVITRFRELTERSRAQSNQGFRILRSLLNYARARYRIDGQPIIIENPVSILSDAKLWHRIQPRSRRVPVEKIGVFWNILTAFRESPNQTTIAETSADILAFLLLTGCRWSEAAELTWAQVTLDDGSWHLPDPKNRQPKTFPLSAPARDILERRRQTSDYVFPARSGTGHINSGRGVLGKISTLAEVDISPHDLRRSFRAVAAASGIEFWKTKLLMGHTLNQDVTISAYTETSNLTYLRPESDKIAAWILEQGRIAAAGNVVPMRRKARK